MDLERKLAGLGFDLIVGFDEVGRGALAGPVMVGAAAVWARDLDGLEVPVGVADSKLLTEHKREAMFEGLRSWCAASAVGQASNKEIDEWGISYALGIAALRAVNEVERELNIDETSTAESFGAVIDKSDKTGGSGEFGDGLRDDGLLNVPFDDGSSLAVYPSSAPFRVGAILDGPNDYISKAVGTFDAPVIPVLPKVTTKVKADQSCALVSTASVIAKVTRDRLMVALAQGNPNYVPYQWQRNKGYGTAVHRAAIVEYGPTPLHRISWHLD
ncbi:ribonuclease HII [Bifidobacterium sp. ESL0732]|uniref:ribonuclease HII n=1 Tax=Bifidobacterium sp. ESL0732 TaxID=2983222 RepID=UPI0023F75CF0|nr:ribonuclease HII [Bifidobacterium sp. ESL0732]WEV64959.1 ribonuclease HII [Bifidobacterium sp. ESL0732]